MKSSTILILERAKSAKAAVSLLSDEKINEGLIAMADALIEHTEQILEANRCDTDAARGTVSEVMLDRLRLDKKRVEQMAEGIREIATLPTPLGCELDSVRRPNGLLIRKISVPIGVIAIIYESRPNVTSDAAALSLKSGNVCVLRGGKEAYRSAGAIVRALRQGLASVGITEDAVNLVEDTTRVGAGELMRANGLVDMLIPRGGAGLIRACVEGATVPCLETGTGICHIYIDGECDLDMALSIVKNGKTSRPSVCNALEVCLVNRSIAEEFLPRLKKLLVDDRAASGEIPVELRLCPEAAKIIDGSAADDRDFDTEFLDYIMAVKVVSDVKEAIAHIEKHSTHHSEAIITKNEASRKLFCSMVDSAAVYVNASTRFTDGGEFGLGCEMGISTQKLHARGPLGIKELTTYKYIIEGDGQIR